MPLTRRDWWLGVTVVALALVLHTLFPRYQMTMDRGAVMRLDTWTGTIEMAGGGRIPGWFNVGPVQPPPQPKSDVESGGPPHVDVNDLIQRDDLVGTGAEAFPGQTVTVHYTGWIRDPNRPDHKGTRFDSSIDRNEPFVFPLGAGQVIAGWDRGVVGMKVGGKRTLTIPPSMAYGARGAGGVIPPDATLVFEVDLLDVGK